MKLAIKENQHVLDVITLADVDVTTISDLFMMWVESEDNVYIYYASAIFGDISPNNGGGFWVKDDDIISVIYAVDDNYDFISNNARNLDDDFNTLIVGNWILSGYTMTANDINQVSSIIGWNQLAEKIGLIIDGENNIAPFVSGLYPSTVNPNTSKTCTVLGSNFDTNTVVIINGWEGTIDDVRCINSEVLEIDVTAGNTLGEYQVLLYNSNKSSNLWFGSSTITMSVNTTPTGVLLPMRISTANGDNYIGTAFSKTAFSNSYRADLGFDGDSGTRHYSSVESSSNHYIGIIMQIETLISKIGYNGEYGSTPFTLQGSDNTTNGDDGTWVDLGNYVLSVDTIDVEALSYVYKSFRLLWSNPNNTTWANAREVIFYGRQ